MSKDKFQMGHVVITPTALDAFTRPVINQCINRHRQGDWGDMDEEDKANNDRALASGEDRLFSAYKFENGQLWIITEWDRSVTTILLPEDY